MGEGTDEGTGSKLSDISAGLEAGMSRLGLDWNEKSLIYCDSFCVLLEYGARVLCESPKHLCCGSLFHKTGRLTLT